MSEQEPKKPANEEGRGLSRTKLRFYAARQVRQELENPALTPEQRITLLDLFEKLTHDKPKAKKRRKTKKTGVFG